MSNLKKRDKVGREKPGDILYQIDGSCVVYLGDKLYYTANEQDNAMIISLLVKMSRKQK